jgi:hypothetical protein
MANMAKTKTRKKTKKRTRTKTRTKTFSLFGCAGGEKKTAPFGGWMLSYPRTM